MPDTTRHDDDDVRLARVTDQTVTVADKGDTRIILTVHLLARPEDAQNPTEHTDDGAPQECEVWITLPADDDRRLAMAVRDLDRLGFVGDDVARLHPDHPQTVSLLGREVNVSRRVVGGYVYWNLAWPRRKATSVAELEAATTLKGKIAAARLKNNGSKDASPEVTPGGGRQQSRAGA